MLRLQPLFLAALLALPTTATADSDQQWVLREVLGSGDKRPTAIFLSWDYSSVVFRATCDPQMGELVLEYFGDGAVSLESAHRLALGVSGAPAHIRFRTRYLRHDRSSGRLEGRVSVTPGLLRLLAHPQGIDIHAPNEMDEGWHVGRAEPLRRVAESCKRTPRGMR